MARQKKPVHRVQMTEHIKIWLNWMKAEMINI